MSRRDDDYVDALEWAHRELRDELFRVRAENRRLRGEDAGPVPFCVGRRDAIMGRQ